MILTRKISESLKIGDEVTVTVLGVNGNQVRIRIDAPKDVAEHRDEIYKRILDEQTAGKQTDTEDRGHFQDCCTDAVQNQQENKKGSDKIT